MLKSPICSVFKPAGCCLLSTSQYAAYTIRQLHISTAAHPSFQHLQEMAVVLSNCRKYCRTNRTEVKLHLFVVCTYIVAYTNRTYCSVTVSNSPVSRLRHMSHLQCLMHCPKPSRKSAILNLMFTCFTFINSSQQVNQMHLKKKF